MGKFIKKEEQPWIIDGRWYHFFVESDGNAYKLTVKDIDGAIISGTYLFLPVGYHIIDMKYDINSIVAATANINLLLRFGANGEQGITLPAKSQFDYAHFWIFCHKE